MSLDTTNWVKFPFSVNGVDFLSMFDPQGSFYPEVKRIPANVLDDWNTEMVMKTIGDPSKLSRNELEKELFSVNQGATQAILALA
jgi:hypothetical protein